MIIRNERKESGQTLVEFAIVVPLLLLLVFGIIEFGIVYNTKITITNAAREGARKAAVSNVTDAQMQAIIQNSLTSLGVSVPATPDSGAKASSVAVPLDGKVLWFKEISGDSVTVYVKGKVIIAVPLISKFFTNGVAILPAKAEMRIEYQ